MSDDDNVFEGSPLEQLHAGQLAAFADKYKLPKEAREELREIVVDIARDRYDEGIIAGGSDF